MPQIIERGRNDTRHIIETANAELVMSVRTWAALVGKKLLAAGEGPRVTRLTQHRIGIRMSSHAQWLASRPEA